MESEMLVAEVIRGILGESAVIFSVGVLYGEGSLSRNFVQDLLFLRGPNSASKEEPLCQRLNSSYRGEPRRERNQSQAMIDQTAAQTSAKCG